MSIRFHFFHLFVNDSIRKKISIKTWPRGNGNNLKIFFLFYFWNYSLVSTVQPSEVDRKFCFHHILVWNFRSNENFSSTDFLLFHIFSLKVLFWSIKTFHYYGSRCPFHPHLALRVKVFLLSSFNPEFSKRNFFDITFCLFVLIYLKTKV